MFWDERRSGGIGKDLRMVALTASISSWKWVIKWWKEWIINTALENLYKIGLSLYSFSVLAVGFKLTILLNAGITSVRRHIPFLPYFKRGSRKHLPKIKVINIFLSRNPCVWIESESFSFKGSCFSSLEVVTACKMPGNQSTSLVLVVTWLGNQNAFSLCDSIRRWELPRLG